LDRESRSGTTAAYYLPRNRSRKPSQARFAGRTWRRGQEALMDDEEVLSLVRTQSRSTTYVFSVCTGALILDAVGLLQDVKAISHWSAFHLLWHYGAIPRSARVVLDGKMVSASGVTAGLDGALVIASLLRGDDIARQVQLGIQYAPNPPFDSGGREEEAQPEILEVVQRSSSRITEARPATAKRLSAKLGVRCQNAEPQLAVN